MIPNEAEARLFVASMRYIASAAALSGAEMDGREVPGSFRTDARDAWYTARDLAERP